MIDVLILMSTYNGEKYLSEQLDSVIAQKDVNVHLLIRDDGSSDSTLSILNEYKVKNPDIIDIINGKNIGWMNSFFLLSQSAERNYPDCNYFAFADQDDIWLPEKLKRAIETIKTLDDGPNLYCSNLTYYKNGKQFGTIREHNITTSYKSCLIRNYATGCTVLFNRLLLKKINKEHPTISIAHDYWFFMVATLCGSVAIDPKSYLLYRQHEVNQIGIKRGIRDIWKRRLHSMSTLIGKHDKESIAKELLRIHGDSMTKPAQESVKKLATYRESIRNRFSLLFDNGYTYNKIDSDFWLKIRIMCGKL